MGNKKELYAKTQRRLIGSLLYESEDITKILELITDEDFEEPAYAVIFAAMAELSRTNTHISAVSVAADLQNRGKLAEVGGPAELFKLTTEGKIYSLDTSALVYARIIKESSAKSKINRVLKDNLDLFTDDSGTQAAEAVSDLQSYLNDELLKLSDSSTVSNFSKTFDEYLELLDERFKITEENAVVSEGLQGIPTLLPSLNKFTTGWLPGQMITVGARTGIGKSVFAVNCATAAAKANYSVMFHSLEMGQNEIKDRFISSMTGIPLKKLKSGTLNDEEKKLLKWQMNEMKTMKIMVDIEPKITVDGIRARALKQAQSPDGLDLIIVDYLQLVTPNSRSNNRQEAVADISRNLKLLAKQLQVPIITLVQLTREKDDDESTLPHLSKIRESGAIAQDSDIVVLLHRDQALDDTTPHTLVILAKNRNGETNKTIRCHSNLECSLFREVTRAKEIDSLTSDDLEEDFDEFEELSENTDLTEFDIDVEGFEDDD